VILNAAVIAALVALISALVKQFLPQFPISDELINSIIVALLGLFGLEGLKLLFPAAVRNLQDRNLLK
jgi:hypothetical protein